MASRPRSLQSRALQLLAQREQSRVELRRKLMVHASAEEAARGAEADSSSMSGNWAGTAEANRDPVPNADADADADADLAATATATATAMATARANATADAARDAAVPASRDAPSTRAAARVDAVMAWLDAHRFVSDERFAESRAHARASRFGNLRIRLELKQHGVALSAETAQALQHTEWSRALDVWQRRFGQAPETAADSAKQARFLMARGFSADTVRRVVRSGREDRAARGSSAAED